MKTVVSRHLFERYSTIKFHGNPSCESRVVPCGRTDGGTDRQTGLVQGKVHPRTDHENPEGEYIVYSSTLSLTSALGGVGGQRHIPAALLLGNCPVPIV